MRASAYRTLLLATGLSLTLSACFERPPIETEQTGYRGTAMVDVQNPRIARAAAGEFPPALPQAPAVGPTAGQVYQNVQVLGDLSVAQFTRLMTSMTQWVSPAEGCNYCHNPQDLASDDIYTKVVSRRMLEMTQHINSNWNDHVGGAGVNCYTCHRGNNVPEYIWFDDPSAQSAMASYGGGLMGQNQPIPEVGYTSLPVNSLSLLLTSPDTDRARVYSDSPFPAKSGGASIPYTEDVYALMIHMGQALNVNCTYCHNTASFQSWDVSNPARVTAYHGINMVRDLNQDYLIPLGGEYPDNRLGPTGDAPKASCLTCHQGHNKPLGGADAVSQYPSLQE